MNIYIFVLFGVSGLIGTELAKTLHKNNEYTIGITRNINKTNNYKENKFMNILIMEYRILVLPQSLNFMIEL